MSASNVEIARRGYEAIAGGDVDAIRDLLDPEVKWHGGDPSAEGACRNRDQALAFMSRRTLPRGVGELVDVVDAGDRVVVLIRPRGARDDAVIANLTTFRDGRVVEMVHYADPEDAFAAAGLAPSPRPAS